MRLSMNFHLRELTKSSTAKRLGIDNTPNNEVIHALRQTALNILQPVRNHFGIPFSPSSGYRSLELNRAIGSKDTSQHPKGEAVDFELPGVPNYELAKWIDENLRFDQLILEFYTPGVPNSGWIHCSYVNAVENRHSLLTFDGKTMMEGLVQ